MQYYTYLQQECFYSMHNFISSIFHLIYTIAI